MHGLPPPNGQPRLVVVRRLRPGRARLRRGCGAACAPSGRPPCAGELARRPRSKVMSAEVSARPIEQVTGPASSSNDAACSSSSKRSAQRSTPLPAAAPWWARDQDLRPHHRSRPRGRRGGGKLLAQGTPEQVAATEGSHTGRFLAEIVKPKPGPKRRPRSGGSWPPRSLRLRRGAETQTGRRHPLRAGAADIPRGPVGPRDEVRPLGAQPSARKLVPSNAVTPSPTATAPSGMTVGPIGGMAAPAMKNSGEPLEQLSHNAFGNTWSFPLRGR